jgi:uncharacterized lipoprotein YddW (UPF0748 family)
MWLFLSCAADIGRDTVPVPSEPPPELVEVAVPREFRAAWISTVWNIDFPSRAGLSVEQQRAEARKLLDVASEAHLNAVMFQVRPEGDAVYRSEIEPWSRWLTGVQGKDPGYDPLQTLIDEGHARGIEVHAWLNPYRARSVASASVAPNHMASVFPSYAYNYGGGTWMDPGSDEVRQRLVAVVADLVRRYDVDGVHFDDYFYPYPDGGREFPDGKTYAAYQRAGGPLGRDDWRRANVNRLVEEVSRTIAGIRPEVRFGISPFGIYRPGFPEGVTGMDQTTKIYSDPLHWMRQGWVDYLAPQLYWTTASTRQPYGKLVKWWSEQNQGGRYTFAGTYLSKVGTSGWSVNEFRDQIGLSRQAAPSGSVGNIHFSFAPIRNDTTGIRTALAKEYAAPAVPPPVVLVKDRVVTPPKVAVSGREVRWSTSAKRRHTVLYASNAGGWEVARLLPGDVDRLELEPGRYVVSVIGAGDVESRGVVVTVR